MKKQKKEIHMGELVKARVNELKRTTASVAKELFVTRQNMHYLYNQKSIDTEMLMRLSRVLGKNFFTYYSLVLEETEPVMSIVREQAITYEKATRKPTDQVVIDFENGHVLNVRHVKEPENNESKRILQLEGLVSNLVSTLKSSGLKFDYPT